MSELIRFGVSIDAELLHKFDQLNKGVYDNRSEAIRDLIRDKLIEENWQNDQQEVAGSLTLIYDHHQRGLSEKMLNIQHQYHSIFKSNLHLHLDQQYCLEVMIIQGRADHLKKVTEQLISLKGVKNGKLTISSTGADL